MLNEANSFSTYFNNIRHAVTLGSPEIPQDVLDLVIPRLQYAGKFVSEREEFLKNPFVDQRVFGTHWGREYFDTIAAMIARGDPAILNRLRLIYNFSGFPIVIYRNDATFPVIDPIFNRYLKLRSLTPPRFRFAAPEIAGEAGWRVDGGVCNFDVGIAQERIQFMYFSGILPWLDRRNATPSIFEIGAGCGMQALALAKCFPKVRYFICDVPEVLTISFSYLNLTMPGKKHYAVLPDGVFDVSEPFETRRPVEISDIDDGFIYIPNYQMFNIASRIDVDMVLNAMSLHEMKAEQISYYACFIAQSLQKSGGIFFDINAHCNQSNPKNDPKLKEFLKDVARIDLPDIGLCGRVWSNSSQTLQFVNDFLKDSKETYDLESFFSIDVPYEHPPIDHHRTMDIMTQEIGNLIGVDFRQWMGNRNYIFANPIQGYRIRYGYV